MSESRGESEYQIDWYRDGNDAPVYRWLTEELSELACELVGAAIREILQAEGPNVCETRFGRQLGKGLFEFRLDGDPQPWIDEARKRRGKKPRQLEEPDGEVLYRIFCHAHGDKIILLLGAYDKGQDTSKKRQTAEIETARKRLRKWQEEERAATARADAAKRPGKK